MSDLFDEDNDDLTESDAFASSDEDIGIESLRENSTLDARRRLARSRLEKMLEKKRLLAENKDFFDYYGYDPKE
jgi:hypothetical protein